MPITCIFHDFYSLFEYGKYYCNILVFAYGNYKTREFISNSNFKKAILIYFQGYINYHKVIVT